MFYIQTCFIQYRSSPEPLLLDKIFSRLMVDLGELLRSNEVHQLS